MTKYLISLLGLSALFLLHGCATVPEPKPQPAPAPRAQAVVKPPTAIPQPAIIRRAADTGVEWVTDVGDLKSRHRFQLAQHIIEVGSATRYYGGSAADIAVGARLRAVGVYHDDVVVADTIYIERSVQSAPVKTATEGSTTTASRTVTSSAPRPPVQAASVSAAPSSDTGADKIERAATKSMAPESSAQPKAEKAKISPPSAKPSPVAAEKKTEATEPPQVNPPPAKSSTQPPGAAQSTLAKAEAGIQPPPGATAPEDEAAKPAGPPTGATATKDFSKLVFNERTLPMSLGHGWTLDRQRDLVDGATRCVLLSPEFAIFDGYYPAKAWLRINPMRAWVKTDSNIDVSYPGQGLRVDGGTLAPFSETLADEQTVYTDAPVLHGMSDGHRLTVAIGFWPTWPKTKTQTASIDLDGFANAYAALGACSQQQQATRE